jgi:hypothetical protein
MASRTAFQPGLGRRRRDQIDDRGVVVSGRPRQVCVMISEVPGGASSQPICWFIALRIRANRGSSGHPGAYATGHSLRLPCLDCRCATFYRMRRCATADSVVQPGWFARPSIVAKLAWKAMSAAEDSRSAPQILPSYVLIFVHVREFNSLTRINLLDFGIRLVR